MQISKFLTDDSKSSAHLRAALKACLLLVLVQLGAAKVKLSGENFKQFKDLDYQDIAEQHLNFETGGTWYWVEDEDENPDDRILEFHSKHSGFLNYSNGFYVSGQSFLAEQFHVLVFFKDKKPIVAKSILGDLNDAIRFPPKALKDYVKILYKRNSNVLEFLNAFPFTELNTMDEKKANKLLGLYDEFRAFLDNSDRAAMVKDYFIPPSAEQLEQFVLGVTSLFLDAVQTGKYGLLKLEDYEKPLAQSLQQQRAAKEQLLAEHKDAILAQEASKKVFETLYRKLEFFAHRSLREYFLHHSGGFLSDLFEGFDEKTSTLDSLFARLSEGVRVKAIEGHKDKQHHLDFPFEYLEGIVSKAADLKDQGRVMKYHIIKNYNLYAAVQKTINLLKNVFEGKVNIKKLKQVDWGETKNLEGLFRVFSGIFYAPLHELYAAKLKIAMMSAESIKKEEKLTDLNNPGQLKVLRRDLGILGLVDFDEAADRPNLFYKKYKIFAVDKGRIVV